MSHRRCLIVSFALLIFFGVCGIAEANSISSFVWFWPGVVSIVPFYAFPASVLAAFIERPFYSAAGLKHRPLVLSLRANLLSAIAGLLLIPIGYPALFTIGPFWCVIAFAVSCIVEIVYLKRFARPFSIGWAIFGNAVSSFVLMTLPPIALMIKHSHRELARSLEPLEIPLVGSAFAASILVFIGSFMFSVRRNCHEPGSLCHSERNCHSERSEESPLPDGDSSLRSE